MTEQLASFDISTMDWFLLVAAGCAILIAIIGATINHRSKEQERIAERIRTSGKKEPMQTIKSPTATSTQVMPEGFTYGADTGRRPADTGETPAIPTVTTKPAVQPPAARPERTSIPVLEIEEAVRADVLRANLDEVYTMNVALRQQLAAFAEQSGLNPVFVALSAGPLPVSVVALRLGIQPAQALARLADMALEDEPLIRLEILADELDPMVTLT